MKSPEDWDSRYLRQETGWDRGGVSPQLEAWVLQRQLQCPCRILIPGCGFGHEVLYLAQQGFDVTAIDFAETAVRHLTEQRTRTGLQFRILQSDVLTYRPDQPFDVVYEQTCLCALPPDLHHRYVEQLASWLGPDGRLFALFMQSHKAEGPPWHCPPDYVRRLFTAENWTFGEFRSPVGHPSGMQEILCILSRRFLSSAPGVN